MGNKISQDIPEEEMGKCGMDKELSEQLPIQQPVSTGGLYWSAPGFSAGRLRPQSLVHKGGGSSAGPTGLGEENYAGSRTRLRETSSVITSGPWELLYLKMT